MSVIKDVYSNQLVENKHICEENVDPRVQVELEHLNNATDLINRLEIELDDARANFRLLLTESSHRISSLAKKLGSCIDKSRPYYEARMKAKELQAETQKAALRFERASSAHTAAKEMVMLAEEGLAKEGRTFDPAWQEMLNHATMRVNEAESERIISELEHQHTSQAYNEAERKVCDLHQELKRSIGKSRSYFEMKAQFNELLEEQKRRVHQLEEKVLKVKMSYAETLHNLELISDEIHERRKRREDCLSEARSEGVGAESPVPLQMNDTLESSPHLYPSLRYVEAKPSTLSLSPAVCSVLEPLTPPTPLATFSEVTQSDLMPKICEDTCSIITPRALTPLSHPSLVPNGIDQSSVYKQNSFLVTDIQSQLQPHSVSTSGSKFAGNSTCNSTDDSSNSLLSHFGSMSLLAPVSSDTEAKKPNHLLNNSSPNKTYLSCDSSLKNNASSNSVENSIQDEFSDTESLTSTGTAETLDDHQIECLLLDRVLQADYHEMIKS